MVSYKALNTSPKLELIETNGIPFLNEGECEKWNFEVHDNIKEL